MAPTYRSGDVLLVRRRSRCGPRRDEIAVFTHPGKVPDRPATPDNPHWLVKRVVAITGDEVPVEVLPALGRPPGATEPASEPGNNERVPPDRYVVRGDGEVSFDSRHFGYVPLAETLGVVSRRLTLSGSEVRLGEVVDGDPGWAVDRT